MNIENMDLNPSQVTLKNKEGGDVVVRVGQNFRWNDDSPLFRLSEIQNNNGVLRFYFETQNEDGSWEESGNEEVVTEDEFKEKYLNAMVR